MHVLKDCIKVVKIYCKTLLIRVSVRDRIEFMITTKLVFHFEHV